MTSDPLSSLALTVTFAAAGLYALYWTIRRAVAHGIRDAASDGQRPDEGHPGPHDLLATEIEELEQHRRDLT
ncbi:hypothetical protein [Leifsonia sp. C5G2]|uniref:hypothetical protein n=1 Tax=Leifsonia sp. C5G2 TaxID=2735269 RepID=UPI001585C36C|nr:hypothetical protein [Leifsonia sp. C5G2]NUU05891.1 hypothetical protein [Leifsonia sp. C5G2]